MHAELRRTGAPGTVAHVPPYFTGTKAAAAGTHLPFCFTNIRSTVAWSLMPIFPLASATLKTVRSVASALKAGAPGTEVHGEYGDLINANEERWHRATSCPNTGRSIRMAITPRSKEGQVHYFQIDQPPGN